MSFYKIVAVGLLCAVSIGCVDEAVNADSAYFESPASAVEEISEMLKAKDWEKPKKGQGNQTKKR